jgi:hypothetical protein
MKYISGIYLGTGSAMTLGLGFKPDEVIIRGVAGVTIFRWSKDLGRVATAAGGVVQINHGSAQLNVKTMTQGIRLYSGGVSLASVDTNILTHISLQDASTSSAVNTDQRGSITTWTLDTAANGTGHFNAASGGTYAGVGSKVVLFTNRREYTSFIRAQTSTWTTADHITLDPDVPASADVRYIGPQYDFLSHPIDCPTPDGIILIDTTYLADATVHELQAWQY